MTRTIASLVTFLCASLLAAGATPAWAQAVPPPEPERVDLIDLLRQIRGKPPEPADEAHRMRVVFAPLIGAKPNTGFRLGVGANFEIALGDETSRLSSLNTGISVSTKKQVAASFQPTLFGSDERWLLTGENQYSPTAVNDVSGGVLASSDADNVGYDSVRFFDTYAHRVLPHLYLGAGLFYMRQSGMEIEEGTGETSPFVAYSTAHGFDLDHQVSAGPGLSLIVDTRDYPKDAGRGYLADVNYRMHFKDFLGGSSSWQRLLVDLRAYRRLSADGRHRMAVWGLTDVITSGVAPYLAQPAVGGDVRGRSGRGYAEGQIRGDRLVYFEAEYRVSLMPNGLVGMVLFTNATTVGDSGASVQLFDAVHPGGGLGVRFQLQKRSRTNLGIDFGVGKNGSRRIYVALSDAF